MPTVAELDRVRCPKLARLIEALDALTSRAELDHLTELLGRAAVTRESFGPCCRFGTRAYKRNTVAASGYYELLCVCWRSGHCTPIHDHRGSSCAFRVVEGVGTEVRFERTPAGIVCPIRTTRMEPGYICAADDADIHTVINAQEPGADLITMHVYTPPLSRINTYKFAEPAMADCAETGAAAIYS